MRISRYFFGIIWGSTVLLAALVIRSKACTDTQVNVRYGSSLVLECDGSAPVTWSSYTAVSSDREIITSLTNDVGEQRSWLVYRNAANSDSRITCSTGSGSCIDYSVKVFTVPSDVSISVQASVLTSDTVLPGDTTTLTCSSSGTSPFQYKWYQNGTVLAGEINNRYRISRTEFSHTGVYTCEVSNWAGRSSGTYTLKVQEYPAITRVTSSAMYNKAILPRTGYTSMLLYCTVSRGSHPVTFQWTHLGSSVEGSSTYSYVSGNEFIGRLYISRLTPSHNGRYLCSTQNTVGYRSRSITITVVDPPVATVSVNGSSVTSGVVQVLNGTMNRFQCLASGSAHLIANWYISLDTRTMNAMYSAVYVVRQLTHGDEGTYTCIVNNTQEGLSHQYSVIVQVYDPIHAIHSSASLRKQENTTVTMSCTFYQDPQDPDPFPQVTWTGPSNYSTETVPQMMLHDRYASSITFTAKRKYYGIFTCSVNDVGVGIIDRSISLTVYYAPEAVDSDSIEVTSKTIISATVEWTQVKDIHYTILYYHFRLSTCNGDPNRCQLLNKFKTIDNTTTYTLDNLTPFVVYSLEIAAENTVGIGPYSEPIMVQSDEELLVGITGSGGAVVLVAVVLVAILVVVGCTWRRRRKKRLMSSNAGKAEAVLDSMDPNYTALDMGKVEPRGPYATLDWSNPKADWSVDTNNSAREYAIPPDAISKPVGDVTTAQECSSKSTDKLKVMITVPVAQPSSKTQSARKKKALLPKVVPKGKKPAPLALPNPTSSNKKEDPPIQSASPTTTSSGKSSVQSPATAKVSKSATKQDKTGKGKQPLRPPASSQHQPATMNVAKGREAPGKLSVAALAKRLEKGTM